MESSEHWKMLLESWPGDLSREGIIITTFQEAIPFRDFLVSPGIVLLERDKPDSIGARKVMLAYSAISAIKITAVRDLSDFQSLGFHPPY
jgi:hypothetical protein